MINWAKNQLELQITPETVKGTQKIYVQCDGCSRESLIKYYTYQYNCKRNDNQYLCLKCKNSDPHKAQQGAYKIRDKARAKSTDGVLAREYTDIKCDSCGTQFNIKKRNITVNKKRNGGRYICQSCSQLKHAHTLETKQRIRQASINLHQDSGFRDNWKHSSEKWIREVASTPEFRQLMSDCGKRPWQSEESRQRILDCRAALVEDPKFIERLRNNGLKLWQDPTYRNKIVLKNQGLKNNIEFVEKCRANSKRLWQDPVYRNMMLTKFRTTEHREKLARIICRRVSNLAITFYSLLDDLGVKYHREYNDKVSDPETIIGPMTFDCVIPREGQKTLLVEIQGVVHELFEDRKIRDQQKRTYIETYFSDRYELKYVWHYEFGVPGLIENKVKQWLGLNQTNIVDHSFGDLAIRQINSKDCRLLFEKYHYLANAERGGIYYGAYLGSELVAAAIFSPLIRQNIGQMFNLKNNEIVELSRFCIHPSYQKKNLGSWFISRCIKGLKALKNYKLIISYADRTHNHDGALYKASNFELHGKVDPDYWYQNDQGWVMHKRTLYGKAVKLSMKESEYAEKYGYNKVYGLGKLRFIYWLYPQK